MLLSPTINSVTRLASVTVASEASCTVLRAAIWTLLIVVHWSVLRTRMSVVDSAARSSVSSAWICTVDRLAILDVPNRVNWVLVSDAS